MRLTRAHLEEDAGKSLHEDFHGMTGIDLNRAGTPLLEIVSEPDMRGAQEAVAYARALHALVRWIGICDGNMQEGSFRCDANVSVRRAGETSSARAARSRTSTRSASSSRRSSTRCARQIELLEDGGKVVQETRLYDPDRDETRSMRTQGRRARLPLLPRSRPAAAGGLASSGSSEIAGGAAGAAARRSAARFVERVRR